MTEEFINNMFLKVESKDKDFTIKFYKKIDVPFLKEMARSIKMYINVWNE